MEILVSILMSAYNCEEFISKSIESLLNQTYRNFELLITDDLSTDSTANIIKSFDDKRIILFQNKTRLGLTTNLVNMQKTAKGKYIARLDSDDFSDPKRLETQVKYLENHKSCSMVCSFAKAVGDKKGIIKTPLHNKDIQATLLFYNPIVHSSVMFRNDMRLVYNPFFKKSQDYALWDFMVGQKMIISTIPKALVYFRYHKYQISYSCSKEQNDYKKVVLETALSRLGIELNDLEKQVWFSFLNGKTTYTNKEISEIVSLLFLIENKNHHLKIYNARSLKKRLNVLFYNLYTIIVKSNYDLEIKHIISGKTPMIRKIAYKLKILK